MASSFQSISFNSVRDATFKPPVNYSIRPGTFAPGTKVQVGSHRVVIEKYLSEGGFAHVYVVRIPKPSNKYDIAVLKRVAVPDKETLANMRTEVETMKRLKGHKHIVTYIDSHASQLKEGGYEVFLLMEYCAGGGLIDFMNTRLQHRLTEPEILKIFSDVTEGVACMHYLKPPLMHRDLKVENVLISTTGTTKLYKLCDFGSAAIARPAAKTTVEGRLIEDDIQRHTTLQYRSPEMIDVYRGQSINEKSDIWALGVLLYKLCYYTTPFEEQGQMAILNAKFRYPPTPPFSNRTKSLIAWMLQESAPARPNIYQALKEVCSIQGRKVPLPDIYSHQSLDHNERKKALPPRDPDAATAAVGLRKASPVNIAEQIPDIKPMRRGRQPNKGAETKTASSKKPHNLKTRNDPFAALDSPSDPVRAAAVDELASRFPSLDDFSLLHDKGSNFEFSKTSVPKAKEIELKKRVTEVLADDAFANPLTSKQAVKPKPSSQIKTGGTKSVPPKTRTDYGTQINIRTQSQSPSMVSAGTMTSPSPTLPSAFGPSSLRIHSAHEPLQPATEKLGGSHVRLVPALLKQDSEPEIHLPRRPPLFDLYRSKSFISRGSAPRSPASSRPSLEVQRKSAVDRDDPINRSHSANSRSRPSSMHVNSNMDYLREHEYANSRNSLSSSALRPSSGTLPHRSIGLSHEQTDTSINSDVDYLRVLEDDDSSKRKSKSAESWKSTKRSSLPASLSNTKNILAGKFGDAFRKFESNNATHRQQTPSPCLDRKEDILTPIAGSVNTDDHADESLRLDETEDLAPEVRRELERMHMMQEEKRVAEAAAAYRQKLTGQEKAGRGVSNSTKASTIQNRVKTLLNHDGSDSSGPDKMKLDELSDKPLVSSKKPDKSLLNSLNAARSASLPSGSASGIIRPDSRPEESSKTHSLAVTTTAATASPAARVTTRPSAPPKPIALRTGSQSTLSSKPTPAPKSLLKSQNALQGIDGGAYSAEEWEASFNKRYPRLSGLDMVEVDVGKVPLAGLHGRNS